MQTEWSLRRLSIAAVSCHIDLEVKKSEMSCEFHRAGVATALLLLLLLLLPPLKIPSCA